MSSMITIGEVATEQVKSQSLAPVLEKDSDGVDKNALKALLADVAARALAQLPLNERSGFLARQYAMPERWLQKNKEVSETEAASVCDAQLLKVESTACLEAILGLKAASAYGGLLQEAALKRLSEFERSSVQQTASLNFSFAEIEDRGDRRSYEDYREKLDFEGGNLLVIADGHSDDQKIARHAGARFCALFKRKIEESLVKEKRSFFWKNLLQETLKEVKDEIDGLTRPAWRLFSESGYKEGDRSLAIGGTTLVVTLLTAEGEAHCLCLGDSLSWLVRATDEGFKCLPLSFVRTFASPKEYETICELLPTGAFAPQMQESVDTLPENLLSSPYLQYARGYGNVSRSLGDEPFRSQTEGRLPIRNAKSSCYKGLRPGDFVVTASDGLPLTSEQIEAVFTRQQTHGQLHLESLTQELRFSALSDPRHTLAETVLKKLPSLREFDNDRFRWAQACETVLLSFPDEELAEMLKEHSGPFVPIKPSQENSEWIDDCIARLTLGRGHEAVENVIQEIADAMEKEFPKDQASLASMLHELGSSEEGIDYLSQFTEVFCWPQTSQSWKPDLQGRLVRFIEEGCHRDNLALWVARVNSYL